MQSLVLVGSGGCMQELLWQITEYNKRVCITDAWNVIGYVDTEPAPKEINVGMGKCPYLGNDEVLLNAKSVTNVAICVGNSHLREKLVAKYRQNPHIKYPNLILSDVKMCDNVQLGEGCIISMDCVLSTEVCLGNFVFLNMGVTICHQGRIGDFTTLSPYAKLAGNVTIGSRCDIGMGTVVIQGKTIGHNVVTGAGSVIVTDIMPDCTVVGVPAKKIRNNG